MTSDIEKWANCISILYGNVSKPVLDIALLMFYLSKSVGWFFTYFSTSFSPLGVIIGTSVNFIVSEFSISFNCPKLIKLSLRRF